MAKNESNIIIPKGNISDRIIEDIIYRITIGDLKPGDKLPTEMEFCEELGVSRNVVREAIKVLVFQGILEIRRGEGTFIVDKYTKKLVNPIIYGIILTKHNMHDLLEMNISMLREILLLSAERISGEELVEMQSLYDVLYTSVYSSDEDIDQMTLLSTNFYKALVRITKNESLIQVYDAILDILNAARRQGFEYVVKANFRSEWMNNYQTILGYLKGDSMDIFEITNLIFKRWDECLS